MNLPRSLGYEIPDYAKQYRREIYDTLDRLHGLSWVVYHYALEEAYDMSSGRYIHYDDPNVKDKNPYAIISFHPSEEQISGSLLDRWMRRFAKYKIHDIVPITFAEFVNMDMLSVATLFHLAKEHHDKKASIASSIMSANGDNDGKIPVTSDIGRELEKELG